MRTIVFWCLDWGHPIYGNYHVSLQESPIKVTGKLQHGHPDSK